MCKRRIDSNFPFFSSRTHVVLTYSYYNTYNTSLRVENSTLYSAAAIPKSRKS